MKAAITSVFKISEETFWKHILQPKSLMYITSPILKFHPLDGKPASIWEIGKVYQFRLFLYGFIPLGKHSIQLEEINRQDNIIRSQESGSLAKVWNHTISFRNLEDHCLEYVDEIEIKAGLLTIPIWIFAHYFYQHRQRRWKKYLISIQHKDGTHQEEDK